MKLAAIRQRIFQLRGEKVLLDFDLAELYEVETRVLNQAVKRNRTRLPKAFMFQLTSRVWNIISSQIVMSSKKHRGKTYLPYAFTEHGVAMAANL